MATITGDNSSNTLVGEAGDDTLLGLGADDTLIGMAGNDLLDGGSGFDAASYIGAGAAVNVNLATGLATGGAGNDTLVSIEAVVGSNFNDTLTGDAGDNDFDGGLGNDVISGGAGYDFVSYASASAAVNASLAGPVTGGAGNDTLSGIEAVMGSDFNDTLTGTAAGDEAFAGGLGNDSINGGAGAGDGVYYSNASGAVNVNLQTGVVTGAEGTDTLAGIENVGGSIYNDVLQGALDPAIFNRVVYEDAIASVVVNLAAGTATGGGGNDTISSFEGVIGSEYNDTLIGDNGANALDGNEGNDSLVGAGGNDTLDGGSGNDTLVGGDGADLLFGGEGGDTLIGGIGNDTLEGDLVQDRINYDDRNLVSYASNTTAGVTINLVGITGDGSTGSGTATSTDSGNDTLRNINFVQGTNFNDTITGSSAAIFEQIEGGGGDDVLDGGAMDDPFGDDGNRVSYQNAQTSGVNVDLGFVGINSGRAVGATTGTDTLLNFNQVRGSSFADTMTGTGRTDMTELFDGRAGDDAIDGGGGIDIVRYDGAAFAVNVNLATGSATGGDGNDTFTNIEGVYGSDFNDTLIGGNPLNGVTLDDGLFEIFRGGKGNDSIVGGQGYDRADYTSSTSGATVNLNTGLAQDGLGGTDTLVGIEAVRGSAFNDTMTGGAGAFESFEGREGNDFIDGGANTDRADYSGTKGSINVNLAAGFASDGYGSTDTLVGIENVRGGSSADTIAGDSGNNSLEGQGGNDSLSGGDGNDTLVGGTGVDTMIGGNGNDVYVVDNVGDVVTEASPTGGSDTVRTTLSSYTLGTNLEHLAFIGTGNFVGTGNASNNSLTGGAGNDSLLGAGGQDTLAGGAGNDTLDGGVYTDRLNLSDANTLSYLGSTGGVVVNLSGITGDGSVGNGTADDGMGGTDVIRNVNFVWGSNQGDSITGSSANILEMFEGFLGNDTIDGGAITDLVNGENSNRVSYQNSGSAVGVDLGFIGTNNGQATGGEGTDTLLNINQVRGSAYNDTMYGSDRTDQTETFEGRAGNDYINGEGGFDVVRYDASTTGVNVNLATGTASDGQGGTDTLVNIEGAFGGNFNDTLTGGDTVNGGAFVGDRQLAEVFRGGAGDDLIDGGVGYDRVDYVSSTTGVVVTFTGGGNGTAQDGLLGNDTLVGIEAVRGSAFNDTLIGSGDAFESFEGREGNDSINGGGGIDRADYQSTKAGINVNLTTGTAADGYGGTDTLLNIENVRGSTFNDTITGSAVANSLEGGAGNDSLLGLAGDDTLNAGTGVDTVDGGDGTADVLRVLGAQADYSVQRLTATDTRLFNNATQEDITLRNVEFVQFSTGGPIATTTVYDGQPSPFADSLTGTVGADTLNGLAGNDTMVGLTGDDTYVVDNPLDVITEAFGEGTDQVNVAFTAAGTYVLGNNVENATVTAAIAGINITGNVHANLLTGNSSANALIGGGGSDTLNGAGGADTLTGGDQDDTYVLDVPTDVVVEGTGNLSGNDTVNLAFTAAGSYTMTANVEDAVVTALASVAVNVTGNDGGNTITGNAAANNLAGGLGDDVLSGNAGSDTLLGGSGSDTLDGGANNDSLDGGVGNDVLRAGTGADTVDGGADSDTLVMTGPKSQYTITRPTATDTLLVDTISGDSVLLRNVELVKFGSDAAISIGEVLANLVTPFGDSLTGTSGSETLDGGLGNDTLVGMGGNDVYVVDNPLDVIVEGAGGADLVQVAFTASGTYVLSENLANATVTSANTALAVGITGNASDNVLTGNAGANALAGGAGDDTLSGGVGADSLTGGLGNDVFIVDNAGDAVVEAAGVGSGTDRVETSLTSYTLGANVENLVLTSNLASTGNGNADANSITGGTGNDTLSGNAGDDTLVGGLGNDSLQGGDGNDNLQGGDGNDTLVGGAGNNLLAGGDGDDVYLAVSAGDTIDDGSGTDRVETALASYSLATTDIENLTYTGVANFTGTGNGSANSIVGAGGNDSLTGGNGGDTLVGNAGNDTLDGGAGDDSLVGGLGNDTYIVDSASDATVELAGGGYDAIVTSLTSFTLSSSIELENLSYTGSSNFTGTGNTLANIITGNTGDDALSGGIGNDTLNGGDGSDALDGGAGVDSMVGGLGNDTYQIDVVSDVVVEAASGGADTVNLAFATAATYAMTANVEAATMSGTAAINVTGNELANTLTGNAGNNSIVGGLGNDTLNASAGNDTLDGGADSDTVVMLDIRDNYSVFRVTSTDTRLTHTSGDVTLIRNVEFVKYSDTAPLSMGDIWFNEPSDFADILTGDADNNTINGGAGNDLINGLGGNDSLIGGTGNDTLVGGIGNDTYGVDNALDVITELPDEGTDVVKVAFTAAGTYTLGANVEQAIVTTNVAGVAVTGNDLDNRFTSTAVNGAGNNTFTGGLGSDLYEIDSVSDVVVEGLNGGIADQVYLNFAAAATYTLTANVEDMTMVYNTLAINVTGNDLDNRFYGNLGNNILLGLGGDDELQGYEGNDSLDGGLGNDTLRGDQGNDTLVGGAGSNQLYGGTGDDVYVVSSTDGITEFSGEGTDRVETVLTSYSLGNNIENLTYTGLLAFTGTGNTDANSIVGAGGNDSLVGLDGNDTLVGNAGNDTLVGGTGADSLVGGLGNDTYYIDGADTVVELAGGGTDMVITGQAGYTLGAEVENLTYTGGDGGNILEFTGNVLANVITLQVGSVAIGGWTQVFAGAGNDTVIGSATRDIMDGGTGTDSLVGGDGDDTYVLDSALDVVVEQATNGNDTVNLSFTTAATYTMTLNVERAVAGAGTVAINVIGNISDNEIIGNAAANSLSGGAGNDTLAGGAGNDTLEGGTGNDLVTGGGGVDVFNTGTTTAGTTFSLDGAGRWVLSSSQGVDTVESIESLQFTDGNVRLERPVGAQEVRANAAAALAQADATVVALQDGGWLTTWTSSQQDGELGGIYLQRFDAAGKAVSTETRINTVTAGDQIQPTVVVVNDGGYVVGWQSTNPVGDVGLYTQRYDAAGQTVGSETLVAASTTGVNATVNPSIGALADGGYLVTWQLNTTGGSSSIFSQRYNAGGAEVGAQTQVSTTAGFKLTDAVTTGLSGGGYVVMWMGRTNEIFNTQKNVYAQHYNANGTPVGGEVRINPQMADWQGPPDVAALPGGGYVTTWIQLLNVYVQRYSATGVLAGTAVRVNTDSANSHDDPSVTVLNDGGYVVTWMSNGQDGSEAIYQQRYSSSGTVVGVETRVNTTTASMQIMPTVAALSDGGWVVTWQSYNQDGSDFGVYSQRYNSAGVAVTTGYALVGNEQANSLVFSGTQAVALDGQGGNDSLAGGSGNDTLDGGAGNDTLDGGAGNDSMTGGVGDDLYIVDSAGDVVVEAAASGLDTVRTSTASYTLGENLENLVYTGSGDFAGAGNALANSITGGAGNDALNGGAGIDTLVGGTGNDSYVLDTASDLVVEAAGGGTDDLTLAFTAASNYTLVANVENATVTSGAGIAVNVTGNALANVINGSAGNNSIAGLAGDDTLSAGTGVDTIDGGDGSDTLVVLGLKAGYTITRPNITDTVLVNSTTGENILLRGIEFVRFSNNVTETLAQVQAGQPSPFNDLLTGGAGNDTFNGQAGDDSIYGLGGNDTLTGGDGNDILDGGEGNDSLIGGLGNDTYGVDSSLDVVVELAGGGTDLVQATANSYTLANEVENLTFTGTGDFTATGNVLANVITGGAGNDAINGGLGNDSIIGGGGDDSLNGDGGIDTLVGGTGNDSYFIEAATDIVVEAENDGTDWVFTNFTAAGAYTLTANVENGQHVGNFAINLTGNALNNLLTGNNGNDTISGGIGNDTLYGQAGNDSLSGGTGNDSFYAGTGVDTVDGGDGTDVLMAGNFANYAAAVRISETDTRLVSLTPGEDIVIRNVESVNFNGTVKQLYEVQGNIASAFGDTIVGTGDSETFNGLAGNDSISGLGGDDTLTGGLGNDTLVGGLGDDTFVVDVATDVVVEADAEGADQVNVAFLAAGTYVMTANVESAFISTTTAGVNITGNTVANTITGNAAANVLMGGDGNDTLNGGLGTDTLNGGSGNDTFVLDNAADAVVEALGGGDDLAELAFTTNGTYTMAANLERATVTAGLGVVVNVTGNDLANIIIGNGANNLLQGGLGDDSLEGGDGNDTLVGGAGTNTLVGGTGDDVYVVTSGDSVVDASGLDRIETTLASYALGNDIENLTYTGALAFSGTGNGSSNVIIGGAANDTLVGNAGNDSLVGNAGNDSLDGGLNDDTMVGGLGNDTYVVDSEFDVVTEVAGGGIDLVQTTLNSYTLGTEVDNVTFTGSGNFTGTGNLLANMITGGAGADALNGGAGSDTLVGGAGDDTYTLDVATDVVTEGVGVAAGNDLVNLAFTAAATYTMAANVERATVTSANTTLAVNVTGNDLANTITGNAGNNVLSGGIGNDTLIGGAGNDSLLGGVGDDVFDAGTGVDTVDGGDGTLDVLQLLGGNFADKVYTFQRTSLTDTLVTRTGTGESILVRNVERFQFADGEKSLAEALDNTASIFNDTITGTPGAESIDGLAGNDSLIGLGGDDILNGNLGVDTLIGGDGDDTYIVDVAGDLVTELNGEGTDLVNVTFAAAGTYVMTANVENATITNAVAGVNVTGNELNNFILGGAGGNALVGGAGNDTLDGGLGSDVLTGGLGDDEYRLDVASDVVVEGADIGIDTVKLGFTSASSYTMTANVENAEVTSVGTFAVNITGNALANQIIGHAGNNSILGLDGNDTIVSGGGSDTIDGGNGVDRLELQGVLTDYALSRPSATTTLFTHIASGAVVTVMNVENLLFAGDSSTPTLATLIAQLGSPGNDTLLGGTSDDTLFGAVGNDSLVGGAGNDDLQGGDGLDTLAGGAGNDILDGGAGNDTYLFGVGDGDDIIDQSDAVSTGDVAVIGAAVGNYASGETTLTRGWHSYNDLVINVNSGAPGAEAVDHLVINDFFLNDALNGAGAIDQIRFATDNSTLSQAQIMAELLKGTAGDDWLRGYEATADSISGGAGNDTIGGAGGNDTLSGGLGNDSLMGDAGNDSLTGDSGNDTLMGGEGNDVLAGGTGGDWLQGGNGNDGYVYSLGGGGDLVTDTAGDADFLSFTAGILASNVVVQRAGTELKISFTGSGGDEITIADYFAAGGAGGTGLIEKFNFADGSSWSSTAVLQKVLQGTAGNDFISGYLGGENLSGGDGNDVILGNEGNDNILGGNGNDTINGGTGNDTLTGGSGNDTLTGGAGADRFVLDSATGVDTITDFLAGVDTIAVSKTAFTAVTGAVGTTSSLAASNFAYDAGTGALSYDADGIGGNAAVTVAIIGEAGHPASIGSLLIVG